MSSPIFRFTKETKGFFGQNQENKEFFAPDEGALNQSGLKWPAPGSGTRYTRKEDGSLEVAIVMTVDDDADLATGAVEIKDVFTLYPDGKLEYRFSSDPTEGAQSDAAWQKKAQFFAEPKHTRQTLDAIKQYVRENLVPEAPLGTGFFVKEFGDKVRSLPDHQNYLLRDVSKRVTRANPNLAVTFQNPSSFYFSRNKNNKLELIFQYAIKNNQTNMLQGFATDVFVLDPKSHALLDFSRTFEIKKKDGSITTFAEEDKENYKKFASDFLEGMIAFLSVEGQPLAPVKAPEEPKPTPTGETPLAVAQKVGEDEFASPLQVEKPKEGPVESFSRDVAFLAQAMNEKIDREADEAKGWLNRLTHVFSSDEFNAEKEKGLVQNILAQVEERRTNVPYPPSIRRALASLPVSGDLKRVRDKMLDDYVVQQISNIAQTPDQEIRSHQYLNLVRKDFLASYHLPNTAVYIASVIKEDPHSETQEEGVVPAHDAARKIFGEFNPDHGGHVRDAATTLELNLPRVMDSMAEPEMLGAFALGGMAGAGVEAAAFTRLNTASRLAGNGWFVSLARNVLGVGAGVVFGEAPVITTSSAFFHSLTHDASRFWKPAHLFNEWASMSLLFGATRFAHGVTGAIIKPLQTSKNAVARFFFQKTDERRWFEYIWPFRKAPIEAQPMITAGPMGRYATLEPVPQLSAFGNLTAGVLNHGAGISTMQIVPNYYNSLHVLGEKRQDLTFMDATLMYGQALIANNLINGASGGRYQGLIAEIKAGAHLPPSPLPPPAPSPTPPPSPTPSRPPGGAGAEKIEPDTTPDSAPGTITEPDPGWPGGPQREPALTMGYGDLTPAQLMANAATTQPPPDQAATGRGKGPDSDGLRENNFLGEAREKFDTDPEMFGLGTQGQPGSEHPALEAALGRGATLAEVERAAADAPGNKSGGDGVPETARDTPGARAKSQSSGEEELDGTDNVRDPEPPRLPEVELDPLPEVEAKAKQEQGWWTRLVDTVLLGGRLSVETKKNSDTDFAHRTAIAAYNSAVDLAKKVSDAAMPWIAWGKTMERDLAQTSGELKEKKAENKKLTKELGETKGTLEAKEVENKDLKEKLKEASESLERLEEKFRDENKLWLRMKNEWEGAEGRVKTWKSTSEEFKGRLEVQRALGEDLHDIVTKLKDHFESGTDHSDPRMGDILSKVQAIITRFKESELSLEKALDAKTQEHEGILLQLTSAKNEISDLTEKLESEKEKLQNEQDTHQSIKVGYEQNNKRLTAIREKLEKELGESIPDDTDHIDQALDSLINKVREQLDAHAQRNELLEQIRTERATLEEDFEDFKRNAAAKADEADRQIGELDRKNAAHVRAEALLKGQLEAANEARETAEKFSKSQLEKVEGKDHEIEKITAEKQTSEATNAELRGRITQLENEIHDLTAQFGREGAGKDDQIASLGRELEGVKEELHRAEVRITSLEGENETLGGANDGFQADLKEEKARVEDLERQLAQLTPDISIETLVRNRTLLEKLPFKGNASEANPASLNPSDPLCKVQSVVITLTREGKIKSMGHKPVALPLAREAVRSRRLPLEINEEEGTAQVQVIWAPEGILWHSETNKLNGRQKAAVADLAQGMAERQEQDLYTASAYLGEGLGPLARDLYHSLKNAHRKLDELAEDGQPTTTTLLIRRQVEGQDWFYRAYHENAVDSEHTDFRTYLRENAKFFGSAKIIAEQASASGAPYEQMTVVLSLSEYGAEGEVIRQVFLKMGKLLANNVNVVFEEQPSGPTGGPAGGPRPQPKPERPKAPAPAEAPKPRAAEPSYEEFDELQKEVLTDFEPGPNFPATQKFPRPPRAPNVDAEGSGEKTPEEKKPEGKNTSSIPPAPRYRIAAVDTPPLQSLKALAPSEIRMGESDYKTGVPSYFERIVELGDLGGATYEGVVEKRGKNGDGIGRFIGPDGSLTLVNTDGSNDYGAETSAVILQAFGEQIPRGASIPEVAQLSSQLIDKNADQNLNPLASMAAGKVNRPAKPGDPYTFQPYWGGNVKIIVQVQVDGQWKLVWQSVDQTGAENFISQLSDKQYQDLYGNVPRDLQVRMHPLSHETNNMVNRKGKMELATYGDGMANPDLAEKVVLPSGEEALKLKPGYRILLVSNGMTANEATTDAIVGRAANYKPGQNPARSYLTENARRQNTLKSAREFIDQKFKDGHGPKEKLRAPVVLTDGRPLFCDYKGVVYDAEVGGTPVDHLASDHFSIQVLDFNPRDLKTTPHPARSMPTAPEVPPSTRREGPAGRALPPPPPRTKPSSPLPPPPPRTKPPSPLPPPPRGNGNRPSPPAPTKSAGGSPPPKLPPPPAKSVVYQPPQALPARGKTPPPVPPVVIPPPSPLPLVTRKKSPVPTQPPVGNLPPVVPPLPRRSPPPLPGQAPQAKAIPSVPPPTVKEGRAVPPPAPSTTRRQKPPPPPSSLRPKVVVVDAGPLRFEGGEIKWGSHDKPLIIGEGKTFGKKGLNDDKSRLNMDNALLPSDFARLEPKRDDPSIQRLTNIHRKRKIFVRSATLTSPKEINPGESYDVTKEDTIIIGTWEIPLK